MKRRCLTAFALLFFLSGCFNLPSPLVPETKIYDLNAPSGENFSKPLDILAFSSDAPAKYKMLYRGSKNELIVDEYHKWTQPPAAMVTRIFRAAFNGPTPTGCVTRWKLRGNILTFEVNRNTGKAILTIRYILSSGADGNILLTKTLTTAVPVKEFNAETYSSAMSNAVDAQIRAVKELLQNLPEGKDRAGK